MIWVLTFILLHGPGDQIIQLAPDQVVELRTPQVKEHMAPGTKCVINTTDGKFTTVQEDCKTVQKLIDERRHNE